MNTNTPFVPSPRETMPMDPVLRERLVLLMQEDVAREQATTESAFQKFMVWDVDMQVVPTQVEPCHPGL